ncbi:MAG: hypothetical protein MI976_19360 [Pseudomonadales bacterium]|nr:hypothetical protein [Pseudomonadales bacterium]
MDYYFFDCFTRKENVVRELEDENPFPGVETDEFTDGKLLDIPENDVAHFYLEEEPKGLMPDLFTYPTSVISLKLHKALVAAGVDNMQTWPAVVEDRESGKKYDYILVNILGLIDAMDEDKSEISPGSPMHTAVLYKTIVIDSTKCNNHHFFRPLNKPSSILISEKIKYTLEKSGDFPYISYVLPENYA